LHPVGIYMTSITKMHGTMNIKKMFRLLRVIIRPSNEPTQDYLIPSALWNACV